jgi:3-mercaptopyruvate sulfurtransferase SseA
VQATSKEENVKSETNGVPSDPVVVPDQMASLGPVRLLDVRPLEAHEADALPGSVRVPIEEWVAAAASEAEGLDHVEAWGNRIAALGIGSDTLALVHDGGEMTEAAGVWFVLKHFGARALVVNGGRRPLRAPPCLGRRQPRPSVSVHGPAPATSA